MTAVNTENAMNNGNGAHTFDLDGLGNLLSVLVDSGYEVFGPQVRDGVIAHDLLRSVEDLPLGWTDEQAGGRYRLVPRDDGARFGYAVGPQSWKELLFPSRSKVWTISKTNAKTDADGLSVQMHEPASPKRAFIGVRPCELAAILKQDRVFLEGPHPDPTYGANRENVFIVAVNCGDPASTCFCTSMGTGPAAGPGYDLALTELVGDAGDADVRYVAETGSDLGVEVLARVTTGLTSQDDLHAARRVVEDAAGRITKHLDADGIRELLYENLESPRWESIAERCLTCGNCTLACPTCFCSDLEDITDLTGDHTERWRVWDSCFSLEYSHLGPGPQRESPASRYRQWMTHKLASWIDQFDESGCVGCGRCITWCPVGIDLTEEAIVFRGGADT
jgi:sulfhydrogenase subunit beta (sulfur reductase)